MGGNMKHFLRIYRKRANVNSKMPQSNVLQCIDSDMKS